jgi:hypothetical protein
LQCSPSTLDIKHRLTSRSQGKACPPRLSPSRAQWTAGRLSLISMVPELATEFFPSR